MHRVGQQHRGDKGEMRRVNVPTSAQLADILTKGLHLPPCTWCVEGIRAGLPHVRRGQAKCSSAAAGAWRARSAAARPRLVRSGSAKTCWPAGLLACWPRLLGHDRGVLRTLGKPGPELDMTRLDPSRPSPGSRWREPRRLVEGFGPMRTCR